MCDNVKRKMLLVMFCIACFVAGLQLQIVFSSGGIIGVKENIGKYVKLGSNTSSKKDVIWQVLKLDKNKVYLLSEEAIFCTKDQHNFSGVLSNISFDKNYNISRSNITLPSYGDIKKVSAINMVAKYGSVNVSYWIDQANSYCNTKGVIASVNKNKSELIAMRPVLMMNLKLLVKSGDGSKLKPFVIDWKALEDKATPTPTPKPKTPTPKSTPMPTPTSGPTPMSTLAPTPTSAQTSTPTPADAADTVKVTVERAMVGATVNATIQINGTADYPAASKYKIYDSDGKTPISKASELGKDTTVFPTKSAGDIINVEILDGNDKVLGTVSVVLAEKYAADAADTVEVTVTHALVGATVNAVIRIHGDADYPTAAKYKIFDADGVTPISKSIELGKDTTVFPVKFTGDSIIVKIFDANDKELATFSTVLI